jgi:hypothetical protein
MARAKIVADAQEGAVSDRIRTGILGRRGPILAAAIAITVVVAGLGAPASSARELRTGFTDNAIFDPSAQGQLHRGRWLDKAKDAKAGIIRISVDWRNTARNKPKTPANPNDPAYGFARLDESIRAATMRGLDVVLTVYRAPEWAEGKHPPKRIQPGAWKPNPRAYGKFGQALARRYSGHFHGLPRVRYFEVWTEPNLTQFLAPQWKGKRMFAPRRYRALLNHFYAGVHAAQKKATVIGGSTSPFGDSRKHQLYPTHPRMHPMVFLRTVLCLNGKLKRAKNCKRGPHLDAVSAHPINFANGPNYKPHSNNDLQVANFSRLGRVVRAAKRAGTLRPKRRKPLWATEAGMLSNPPNPKGAPVEKHARWIEQSLYLLWKQGASVVLNLNIRDTQYDPNHAPSGQWNTGIYFHNGNRKPAAQAFRFPFVTDRKSRSLVRAWGKAPRSGELEIQVQKQGEWRAKKRLKVQAGKIFKPTLRLRGRATLRARLRGETSIAWPQSG